MSYQAKFKEYDAKDCKMAANKDFERVLDVDTNLEDSFGDNADLLYDFYQDMNNELVQGDKRMAGASHRLSKEQE